MKDSLDRTINYIRISVTDRCNLRCFYCMPLNRKFEYIPHSEIMRYEEITEFLKTIVKLGIRNVRITGGEPLVRRELVKLIEMIREIEEIQDISLTTNGILLTKHAKELKGAGLNRVNISLDTLDEKKFKEKISPHFAPKDVLQAIYTAIDMNLSPVKVNIIPIKDFNDNEILDFIKLTSELPIHIRFIEIMPVSQESKNIQVIGFINNNIIRQLIEKEFGPLEKIQKIMGFGPSIDYKIPGFKGSIGFISHISQTFCHYCNRIRLTSNGYLKRCLYEHPGIYIRNHIQDIDFLKKIIFQKPKDYLSLMPKTPSSSNQNMFKIGG